MSISLETLVDGDTDYIGKHNRNNSKISSQTNPMEADVAALKAASGAGADLDFRLASPNLVINGGLDYWQRGNSSRPDAWRIISGSAILTREDTEIKLNTYSIKTVGAEQLGQDIQDEIRLGTELFSSYSFGAYIKTDTVDQARIGIYDGTTTTWSAYHTGNDSWRWITVNVTFSAIPDDFRLLLESNGGTVYWNSIVMIRGNPFAGPIFIANDPTVERLRVNSLYEIGSTNVRGVGFLNAGDRELESRLEFIAPKRAIPAITISNEETGYDFLAVNVDRHGFNLQVAEIGNSSGTGGFEKNDIDWKAEVIGT